MEQISWDEAIQEIASKFTEISEKYGPKAVVFDSASGQYGFLNGIYNPLGRLSGVMGATKLAVSYDYAAGHGIDRVLGTGDWSYCNEPNSVMDSSLVVIWGTNARLARSPELALDSMGAREGDAHHRHRSHQVGHGAQGRRMDLL